MSQSIYYHNITKDWYNENDYGEAVENSEKGDLIKFSVRGNAQMFDLEKLEPEDAKDYDYAKEQFCNYYYEFTGEYFYKP